MQNYLKLIFRDIKASYLILSTLGILCVQDNSQGVAQSCQGAFTIEA